MILWTLIACGSSAPKRAEAPDPKATLAVAEALCKVAQTAKHQCKLEGAEPVIDGTIRVRVRTYLDLVEEKFGLTTFEGRIAITPADRPTVTTHFRHYGMSHDEAMGKGVHMWAVVDAASIVDWILSDTARPALHGLYKQETPPASVLRQGNAVVLPGWTYREGVQESPNHEALVKVMASHVPSDGVHMVDLRIQPQNGRQERHCHVDGEPAEALCAALPTEAFPAGVGWGLKQAWLWAPASQLREAHAPG
ncbi:MAG: hypothetical protein AAGA48_30670 [Myxococcota bacterium]